MNPFKRIPVALMGATVLLMSWITTSAVDADVRAQLSSRTAYVGMPIQMFIQINGGDASSPPELPSVPGLTFEMAGAPNRTSRVTIFNGRRTESRSTTYVVRVTPRRAGSFEIPPLEIKTDRGTERTQPLVFSATTSETGDLMFVEVTGQTEKLYVGQSVDVTMKIWIKPYVDTDLKVTLSPATMWQMVSLGQSEWGGFRETLENLAARRRTIRGREVQREDGDGVEHPYYLYEIDATLYPLTPGLLDVKDVRVVAQYPLALGRSRDPFEAMFGADDFFSRRGGSPFGGSLTVTSARPIGVEPRVAPIEVVPIPTTGRPSGYRGAVGQYAIATQAAPTEIKAGDPITLNIGIQGTGPMELVQAPLLSQMSMLTTDFKVADGPLAGVVQDDVKVFSTTIRPRRAGINQIPAIPFCFFDPIKEEFVTVTSDPISIVVKKADRLALDTIVDLGNRGTPVEGKPESGDGARLDIHTGAGVLVAQRAHSPQRFAFWILVIPPAILVLLVVFRLRTMLIPNSGFRVTIRDIHSATRAGEIATAVETFAQQQNRNQILHLGSERRSALSQDLESEIQSLVSDCDRVAYSGKSPESLDGLKRRGTRIVKSLGLIKTKRFDFRIPMVKHPIRIAAASVCMVVAAAAWQTTTQPPTPALMEPSSRFFELSRLQQVTLLSEATAAYQRGRQAGKNDVANAASSFSVAAQKYQLLVDSGIQNSRLYFNLGNANLQTGNVGLAIVNYRRSSKLNPINWANWHNLRFAQQMAQAELSESEASVATNTWDRLKLIPGAIPQSLTLVVCGIGWLSLWGLLLLGWTRPGMRQHGALSVAVVVFLIACSSLVWESRKTHMETAVVIANHPTMYTGSEPDSSELPNVGLYEGQTVQVIQRRGGWIQVESTTGQIGWVKSSELENG